MKTKSDVACDWPWTTCLVVSAIHSLWFFLLGLSPCGKDQAAHQSHFLPGLVQQNFQSTRGCTPPAGCLLGLVNEIVSSSTPQQQDLITTGWGRVSHVGGAIASPQADHLEASTLPEKDVSRSTGNDLAQGTWQLFLQFSPQSYQPQSLLTHP